ncbi:MAG TPA: hypothetical protein VIY73_07110, partial [Polyangiaceae bacterium]
SGASSSGGGSGSGSGSGGSSSGGTSSSSGSGSGGSSSGGGSGSSGSGGSPCPSSADPGGSCSPEGLQCEYGTNPDPSCNLIENCQSGHWSYPPPGVCPVGQCPPTYPDSSGSVSCTPDGFDCAYPQGQCNCSVGALAGNPADPHWWCSPVTKGCPEPRAPLGTACTEEGLQCDYGACTGGIAEQCTNGIWVEEATACPLMAGAR